VRKSILLINTCFKVKLISMDTKQTTRRLNVVREHNIRTEDVLAKISRRRIGIGFNRRSELLYGSGFDMKTITAAGHEVPL
jgi:hypothetical protein